MLAVSLRLFVNIPADPDGSAAGMATCKTAIRGHWENAPYPKAVIRR
jgi:hypothetical protein